MPVATHDFHISTKGHADIIDVTDKVQDLVRKSGLAVLLPAARASGANRKAESERNVFWLGLHLPSGRGSPCQHIGPSLPT